MTRRLALALIDLIRRIDAPTKFLVMEAVPISLAAQLQNSWKNSDPKLPTLAIVKPGEASAKTSEGIEVSVAHLRHTSPNGVCVVVCEGGVIAERQSINNFVTVSPSQLLESKTNLMLLSEAVAPVRRDGPLAAIRDAVVTMPAGLRPSALSVAAYFDTVAGGTDPLAALPAIGGFRDSASPADVRSDRVRENFRLAAMPRTGESSFVGSYADVRRRAERVLARRATQDFTVDHFMSLLESGDDQILEAVSYGEAQEILLSDKRGLTAVVRQELSDFRRVMQANRSTEAAQVPWGQLDGAAESLERSADRKQGARDLLDFDQGELEQVFLASTRRKLLALTRDRSFQGSPGSALEVAIARGIRTLGTSPKRLVLVNPHPVTPPTTQSAARETISLATARLRLSRVLLHLESVGCEVDGDLTLSPLGALSDSEVEAVFVDASIDGGTSLPIVKIRLHSDQHSVTIDWSPDIDDIAFLRVLVAFSSAATLYLEVRPGTRSDLMAIASAVDFETPAEEAATAGLARALRSVAQDTLRDGLRSERLRQWVVEWTTAVSESRGFGGGRAGQGALLAGCLVSGLGGRQKVALLSPLSPWKAEWLATYCDAGLALIEQALSSFDDQSLTSDAAFETAAQAIKDVTAAHFPPFLRLHDQDEPLLPVWESRIWSAFGGNAGLATHEVKAKQAVDSVLRRLLRLQPEAAGHLRCLALGPGSAALMLAEAVRLVGEKVDGVEVEAVEIFAIGDWDPEDIALTEALAEADAHRLAGDGKGTVALRYIPNIDQAREALGGHRATVHFALLTGISADDHRPAVQMVKVAVPETERNCLFAPRVWQRPDTEQRMLLMPPGLTDAGIAWMRLAEAVDDRWPENSTELTVPEMRIGAPGILDELRTVHEMAMWVATLDRYATRESLERVLGDEVAILHQERRLGSESPVGLVVSQKAGGPIDRAIGRSLRQARIVADDGEAVSLGAELRRVAAQGYGILALEAATSGTGINELVGHVVGFSLLGTRSTPWPLPPGCRVLLLSLDEHPEWFMGQKRADLLALAIDLDEVGVHGAVIEVKARRSSSDRAGAEALEQLRKTLTATSFAATPDAALLARTVWLNRIAESVYAVARESRIRLSEMELGAIEAFRRGRSTFEWAGLGLVFGPTLEDRRFSHNHPVGIELVPIVINEVRLTQERLLDAVATDLRELRTAEVEHSPLGGGRIRRRPESGVDRPGRSEDGSSDLEGAATASVESGSEEAADDNRPEEASTLPTLGWDQYSSEPFTWRMVGPGGLSNAHVQIWGSAGAGKTEFIKLLLRQLNSRGNMRFGIADFKNDYGNDFPGSVSATFIDLWGRPGARFNPLALSDEDDIDTRIIEFRDSVDQAMASYQRVGTRQRRAIENALRAAYREAEGEDRWPTLMDLNRHVSDEVEHILGDLTKYEIFTDGPPMSEILNGNLVFGLSRIPGNGQTTVLAAAFLLAGISLAVQSLPPVPNTLRYALVVDEAHRVSRFKALDIMVREGRSKGLAVVLATQSPLDLPEVVDTNAQTRICFRLSDAVVATQAAKKLDPADETLPDRIRTLGSGEAFISLQGERPRLITAVQNYRDGNRWLSGGLSVPPE